eukprot:5265168-Pleurochrysis_carterae.AAC.1
MNSESTKKLERRRWLLVQLYNTESIMQTETYVIPFEGAILLSVRGQNPHISQIYVKQSVTKFVQARSPRAIN